MKTQQILQVPASGARAIPRWGLWLVLAAVLIPVLVFSVASLGAPSQTDSRVASAARPEPAAQSVMDYLRAHSSIPDHAVYVDPAAQGVAGYLRAHSSIPDHAVYVDPAAQGVAGYLRAHANDAGVGAQKVPEAAAQGVMDYVRAHGAIPDHAVTMSPAERSVSDYLRVHTQ